ncbi:Os02g0630650 [Oryza sativa Japonica Group]|uniref:Os02g0630650 protein n=1 Tax=Oryza sativa subsp. japonica TaxID=39947 RepID=A0A0P0VLX5_ORYSJ|nr:Os02g0630650 [Oryza sativa Japonica Group]
MVTHIIHTLRLEVRDAAGARSVARCSSLSSFISLKYIYSWLIACCCTCSKCLSV